MTNAPLQFFSEERELFMTPPDSYCILLEQSAQLPSFISN